MRLEYVEDTSGMHAGHVWVAHEMRLEHAQDAPVQVQNLAIKLQQY